MNSAELQPFELMQIIASFMEKHEVSYRIVGSLASMAYGEPRFTNDVDVLADLPASKADLLCEAFPAPEYYLAKAAVIGAISGRRQFNILHIPSGLKVDVILSKHSDYGRLELTRGKRLTSDGEFSAWFGSPEDVILNKLIYFQSGLSEKHLRDIAAMFKIQGDKIDRSYIEHWGTKLGVLSEWEMICARLQDSQG